MKVSVAIALPCLLAVLSGIVGVPQATAGEGAAAPDQLFNRFLDESGWSDTEDDNNSGERLTSDLIKGLVDTYRKHPDNHDAQFGLGLVALGIGVAEWGVDWGNEPPADMPKDPAGKDWASDANANSGKHLMSYAIGGVGISHADQSGLLDFITYVGNSPVVPVEHRSEFLKLASPDIYTNEGKYDQLRAAGLCSATKFNDAVNGEAFDHPADAPKAAYCEKYKNSALAAKDWQLFRTWTRAALRTRDGQKWLIDQWMKNYWFKSLSAVPVGDGQAEEVLVNVRVRNSSPKTANKALQASATDAHERVQRELDAYRTDYQDRFKRRCGFMLRPVVLYRYFAGLSQLSGVKCPE